ncbi:MAG: bZIP transcription factor [Salinigranum sp.]
MVPLSLALSQTQPLQFVGMPGGPELLIILLVLLIVFGIPILVVGGGAALLYRSRNAEDDEDLDDRVRELEREVDELREALAEERGETVDGDPVEERP